MFDSTLLALAAKAAGVTVPPLNAYPWYGIDNGGIWANASAIGHLEPNKRKYTWAPLASDGDALRLAVKLNIVIWECAQYDRAMAEVRYGAARGEYWEPVGGDPHAATRRAIVRAAAEIGKVTP